MDEYSRGRTTIRAWPEFTKEDVEAVICNLRATDVHEAEALGLDTEAAHERRLAIVGTTPVSYMVYYDGAPVFMWGVTPYSRHHVGLWGFGTDATVKTMPAVTRYVTRQWLRNMGLSGVSRIEARLPASCRASTQWLKSLGFRHECQLAGASVTGEPLSQLSYTWITPDVHTRP